MELQDSHLIFSRRQILAVAGVGLVGGAAGGVGFSYFNAQSAGAQGMGQPGGGMGGADTMSFDYSGSYTGAVEADGKEVTGENETYAATEADQNAALAQNGGKLTLTNATLTKEGDDTNGDNCNFYGVNSIATAVGSESTMSLEKCDLSATSEGSNGIFATDNAQVTVKDTSITTTAGNSRGLDATYGGSIEAESMSISTQGDHCAGIATDRGGGTIVCKDSTITTAGSGSPVLYSTGSIQVEAIKGTATGSQLCGMEGLNTILIKDSTLVSEITGATASDPVADGVIIYQSTSGDAEATTGDVASFQAVDSELTSAITSGAMFYLTNTSAAIVLKNTALNYDSNAVKFLYAAGNDSNNWGSAGQNGANVTVTAEEQTLTGDIAVDTISSVKLFLKDGSIWTGAGGIETNANGSTSENPLIVNVDEESSWVVTADCNISALNVEAGGKVVDSEGKTVSVVANGDTVVTGESGITVTAGSYATAIDDSDEGELNEFFD